MEITVAKDSGERELLAAGCDFWITAQPEVSTWGRKLDWYLNFQIMKAGLHRRREISSELRSIVSESETDIEFDGTGFASNDDSALMIASRKLLPTRKLIVVNFSSELSAWVSKSVSITSELTSEASSPGRVRIFLPDSASATEVERLWRKFSSQLADSPSIELIRAM